MERFPSSMLVGRVVCVERRPVGWWVTVRMDEPGFDGEPWEQEGFSNARCQPGDAASWALWDEQLRGVPVVLPLATLSIEDRAAVAAKLQQERESEARVCEFEREFLEDARREVERRLGRAAPTSADEFPALNPPASPA